MAVSKWLLGKLECPGCHRSALKQKKGALSCGACKKTFQEIDGVPILIDGRKSLFDPKDISGSRCISNIKASAPLGKIKKWLPSISKNFAGKENYTLLRQLLTKTKSKKFILIIGGGEEGQGINALIEAPNIIFIKTDVYRAKDVSIICDAHDLPFKKASFDAVIAQAVLEHVLEPQRCVNEMFRVLKKDGLIYAETPFMQQVHEKQYDFMRFTDLGHRRLFRQFDEINRGICCGPGMAAAWAWRYYLVSLTKNKYLRLFLDAFARLSGFWLKCADKALRNNPGAYDAASGYFFLGKKSSKVLDDRALIKLFRGYKGF